MRESDRSTAMGRRLSLCFGVDHDADRSYLRRDFASEV